MTRGVDRLLGRLPQLERSVLELRFGVSGGHPLPVVDVAARLGLTAGEVAEMERRALHRLREVLDPAEREMLGRLLVRLSG